MLDIKVRKLENRDMNRILELNEESVHFLSPLTLDKLEYLRSQSEMFKVLEIDGCVEAFVLTLLQDQEYDSVNYKWFSTNYKKFLYIDRVVVSKMMQGKGLGPIIYVEVFKHAKSIKTPYIAAEIDIMPANPNSLKFHKKFGFKEVGTQTIYDGKKSVSLQIAELSD